MSHYMVDERDVLFTLFDWIKAGELSKFPKIAEVDFDETTGKDMLKTSLQIAKEVLGECYKEMDHDAVTFADGNVTLPDYVKKAYNTFCENGLLGMHAAPEYGGYGMPNCLNIASMEYFCGSNNAFVMYAELTAGAAHLIEVFGNDDMKAKYVEKMYTGQWTGTMCLTEPGAGSDVGALKTKAIRQDDGTFKIVGTKIFISSGDHDLTDNIIHPVLARIEGAEPGVKGISLFLVPKYLVNDDGSIGEFNDVVTGNVEHKMGIKGNATCTLNFGESNNCTGWLIGEENKGIVYMFQMMNEARLFVGMQAAGIAGTAYMNALNYAKERVQFRHIKDMAKKGEAPSVPIVEHPDIRRMLMHMKSMSEGMRAMLFKTAYWGDLALNVEDETERTKYQDMVELMVPICKAYCTDKSYEVTELAIQVFGGYGFCQEYPVEQYARDCKIFSLYEGTNGIQALDLLGRKLPMKGGRLFMQYMQELSTFCGANGGHKAVGSLVGELQKTQMKLAEFVMGLQATVKAGGLEALVPVLNACPLLEAMGHITVNWMLLDMAVMAQAKLDELVEAKGVNAEDGKALREFIADNDEAKFLYGKVKSAEWFTKNMLPHANAIFEAIKNKDLSAMKVIF